MYHYLPLSVALRIHLSTQPQIRQGYQIPGKFPQIFHYPKPQSTTGMRFFLGNHMCHLYPNGKNEPYIIPGQGFSEEFRSGSRQVKVHKTKQFCFFFCPQWKAISFGFIKYSNKFAFLGLLIWTCPYTCCRFKEMHCSKLETFYDFG